MNTNAPCPTCGVVLFSHQPVDVRACISMFSGRRSDIKAYYDAIENVQEKDLVEAPEPQEPAGTLKQFCEESWMRPLEDIVKAREEDDLCQQKIRKNQAARNQSYGRFSQQLETGITESVVSGFNVPEPTPVANDQPASWDLVIADMRERDKSGQAKYGTRLQPFNGRKSLVDAYQELLDACVYLRTKIEEESQQGQAISAAVKDAVGNQLNAETEELQAQIRQIHEYQDLSSQLAALRMDRKQREREHAELIRTINEERIKSVELARQVRTLQDEVIKAQTRNAEHDREIYVLKQKTSRELHEIEQALGKAMHYPEIYEGKGEDNEMITCGPDYPGAKLSDVICVGDHTAVTLAREVASRFALLEKRLPELQDVLSRVLTERDKAKAQMRFSEEDRQRLLKQLDINESELRAVDIAIGNCRAFDGLSTRAEKIVHSISTCSKLDYSNNNLSHQLKHAELALRESQGKYDLLKESSRQARVSDGQ